MAFENFVPKIGEALDVKVTLAPHAPDSTKNLVPDYTPYSIRQMRLGEMICGKVWLSI